MVRAATVGTPDLPTPGSRVAVIGLGMAGLTTASLLAKRHQVRCIEALPEAGLHYHSIADGDMSFDVPLRAMSPHYYSNLFRWYSSIGVELEQVNYQSTGTDGRNSEAYFKYQNLVVGNLHLSWPDLSWKTMGQTVVIVVNYLWLVFASAFLLHMDRDGALARQTMGDHLRYHRYSPTFVDRVFLPIMSTLLSCSYAQVLAYPAELILAFFSARRTNFFTSWWRLKAGVRAVSAKLLEGLDCRYSTKVNRVVRSGDGRSALVYIEGTSEPEVYDYVVIATDAPVAKRLLADPSPAEAKLLAAIDSFTARIVAHTDSTLMPKDQDAWSGLNYFSMQEDPAAARSGAKPCSSPRDASMTTAFMTAFGMSQRSNSTCQLSDDEGRPGSPCSAGGDATSPTEQSPSGSPTDSTKPVFQTWNPYREPASDATIRETWMSRAVWSVPGLTDFDHAVAHGAQGSRRVWFAGSYMARGVTLLEQAATSGLDVAEDFGVPLPFAVDRQQSYNRFFVFLGGLLHLAACAVALIRNTVQSWFGMKSE